MIYSVVKIQVNGLTFSWFGINPFTHLDKGGQNAHPKSPLFQKFLENIFLETKKPPISLVIEVNRRRVEIFIILVYNRKLRERQILLMFVKQIFEDFEYLENRKKSNLNKTCCCRPFKNGYNESGRIYLYSSIARA